MPSPICTKADVLAAARKRWSRHCSFRIEHGTVNNGMATRVWLWHRKPQRIGWEVAAWGNTLADLLAKIEEPPC